MGRIWPAEGDYEIAIQNIRTRVDDPELKAGTVEVEEGMPLAWRGNFGILFQIKCKGQYWALKCFTRGSEDEEERYSAISEFINTTKLSYFVGCNYIRDIISVSADLGGGKKQLAKYPLLKMEWVEGVNLIDYIQKYFRDNGSMSKLADRWVRMVADLQNAGVAHGDLQFGNVLLVADKLKLVDYDGMYVPTLAGRSSAENGHPNFQHPDRTAADYGPYLDNFSAWVIYVSLVCIALDPELWVKSGKGLNDALLFQNRDFVDPNSSRMFSELLNHSNEQVRQLGTQFHSLVNLGTKRIPALSDHILSSSSKYFKAVGVRPGFNTEELKRTHSFMSSIWAAGYYNASTGLQNRAIAKLDELNEAVSKLEKVAVKQRSAGSSSTGGGDYSNTVSSKPGDGSWLWDDFETGKEDAGHGYEPNESSNNLARNWLKECRNIRGLVAKHGAPKSKGNEILESGFQRACKALAAYPILLAIFPAVVLAAGAYISEPLVRSKIIDSIAADMQPISGGGFLMGSTNIEAAKPLHPVSVRRFMMGKCEITQDQFEFVQGWNPSRFKGVGNRPVESVSWVDCHKFIETLNKAQKKYVYRLPTEAEWEYACRANSITDYNFGNNAESGLVGFAWCGRNSKGCTHPVGMLTANRWGLKDIYGNVWEWCEDRYDKYSLEMAESWKAVTGEGCSQGERVLRGGSWLSYCPGDEEDRPCRSSYRFAADPTYRSDTIGFASVKNQNWTIDCWMDQEEPSRWHFPTSRFCCCYLTLHQDCLSNKAPSQEYLQLHDAFHLPRHQNAIPEYQYYC